MTTAIHEVIKKHPTLNESLLNVDEKISSTSAENISKGYLPTGFTKLDQALPYHGLPKHCLIELYCPISGIGELRLLLPFIRQRLQEEDGWVLWVDPPYCPYGPALATHGIDSQRMLIVDGCKKDDRLWTIKQGLKSESCLAVFAWPGRYSFSQLRQLQLYASSGKTSCFIFQQTINHSASSAAVKLRLSPGKSSREVQVELLKCRGRWPTQEKLDIELPHAAFVEENLITPRVLASDENTKKPSIVDISVLSSSHAR